MIKSITPFLWFDDQAEQAMNFYCSVFKDSKVHSVNAGPEGKAMYVEFELHGQRLMALNGGPQFKMSEAFSLFVSVETQAEVDELWSKLTSDGGEESMCGWLKDRYGLWWQIIPAALFDCIYDTDQEKAGRAMQAMFQMRKIDIAALQKAHAGG
jgi:predicted 3-demethylubiquinone-9 3-methyltransferase (glyoxalase superfamily)